MRRLRRTTGLPEVIDQVLRKADPGGKRHSARAVAAWREVAGPVIAEHTRGFALREGQELVVLVDSPAWAQQLSLMADELAARLNAHLGRTAVRSLRFVVSRRVAQEAAWERLEAEVAEQEGPAEPDPVPLTETERAQAAFVADAVRDPRLREVVLKVMVQDLERKKARRLQESRQDTDEGMPAAPEQGV